MGCLQSKVAHHDKPLGLSVHYLATTFMEEVKSHGEGNLDESSKIYELENIHEHDQDKLGVIRSKGKGVVCPRDGRLGAAYVDCLEGADNVGPSTFMLSYCWGYTIGDIVETLVDYCESQDLDMKRSYIWICCLCNNQHRVAEMNEMGKAVEFEEFQDIFFSRVTGIGHILAMMDPWEKPFYLTRVWCVFELYTANSNDECEVTVVMPPREKIRMIEALQVDNGIDILFNFFAETKIENAQASLADDKDKILNMIEKDPGFDSFNISVNDFLRQWVAQHVLETAEFFASNRHLRTDEYLMPFFNNIGMILSESGETTAALKFFQISLNMHEDQEDTDLKTVAKTYINIGETYRMRDMYDEALENAEKAIAILKEESDQNSEELCLAYNNAGTVLHSKGRHDDALEYYEAAVKGQLELSGETKDSGQYYSNLGLVYADKGKYDQAISYYRKAIGVYEKYDVLKNSPFAATVFNNIGMTYLAQANYEEALVEFKKALNINLKLIGTHNDTLVAYSNMALANHHLGKLNLACEEYEKAIELAGDQFGEKNRAIPLLLGNYGELKVQMGDFDGGLDMLHKAEKAYIFVYGPNHPDQAKTINSIALALSKKGEMTKAIKNQERALVIMKEVYGEDSIDAATSYNNLGHYYCSMENVSEGMPYYEKALKICKTIVGEKHPIYGRTLNNIALAYAKQGDTQNALINYKAAAAIYEEKMNDGQFDTVTILMNLGGIQVEVGELDEAITTLKKAKALTAKGDMPDKDVMVVNIAFEIAKIYWNDQRFDEAIAAYKNIWEENEFTSNTTIQEAMAHYNLGVLYQSKQDYKSAVQSYKKSMEMRKSVLGLNHYDTALASNNLGLMMYNSGDIEGALAQHKHTIDLHETNGRTVEVALSYYNYGLALFKADKLKESLLFLEKAYDIWVQHLGPEETNTKSAENSIAFVKEKLNII